jgi:hypothetical protein
MKTKTNTKAGGTTYQHNEIISSSNNIKRNDRPSEKQSSVYGVRVMSVRSGVKAGWVSRNYK